MGLLPHWDYYATLEADFVNTNRYVAVDAHNFKSYSNEFVRLLLAIGSEVDVVAKLMCQRIDPTRRVGNIDDYRVVILPKFPGLPDTQLFMPKYEFVCRPWDDWGGGPPENPRWWRAYNDVKHARNNHFVDAHLENVLEGLLGLYVMVGHLYGKQNLDHAPHGLVSWEQGGF